MTDIRRDVPKPPVGLRPAGRRLWTSVLSEFDLRIDELQALELACRTLDEIRALEAQLKESGPTVLGPRRRQVANPLYEECRRHRAVYLRALRAIALADAVAAATKDPRAQSSAGRALAAQRWERHGNSSG